MIQQIIQKIYTRPIRQKYYIYDLGPKYYSFNPSHHLQKRKQLRYLNSCNKNQKYLKQDIKDTMNKIKRQDHKIKSPNTIQLHVSFYKSQRIAQLQQNRNFNENMKCYSQNTLIYLHTHNGSKLEGLNLIQPILSLGINFCTFDFSGYGNSKGNQATLGIKEIYDLQRVIQFLEQQNDQIGFILWGRSMGAVTALKYLSSQLFEQSQYNVLGAIYDSPFSSLQKLTYQLCSKNFSLPQSIVTPLVFLIKSHLQQKIPFEQLQLTKMMGRIRSIPGLFLASKKDTFITHQHSEKLYKEYFCKDKQIFFIERNHNQARSYEDLVGAFEFIQQIICRNANKQNIVVNNITRSIKERTRKLNCEQYSKKWLNEKGSNYSNSIQNIGIKNIIIPNISQNEIFQRKQYQQNFESLYLTKEQSKPINYRTIQLDAQLDKCIDIVYRISF